MKKISLKKACLTIFIILCLSHIILFSEDEDRKDSGIVFVPGAFYTPETDWGFAAGLLYYFQCCNSYDINRPSSLSANIIYTLENQKMLTLIPNLFIDNGRFISNSRINLRDYPEKFYGIGNDNPDEYSLFTNKGIQFSSKFSRLIFDNTYAGININYKNTYITDIENNDSEKYAYLISYGRTQLLGIGLHLSYDTRDNLFYTSEGTYINLSAEFFSSNIFGFNDFDFESYIIDMRYFYPIYTNVFAIQTYFHLNSKDCPFYSMPTLGGPSLLRGVIQNRYRDRNLLAFQSEYRMPVSRKFTLIFFGGLGNVYNKLDDLEFDKTRYGIGAGLRYRLSDTGINLRADIGYSDKDINFYLGVLEAF